MNPVLLRTAFLGCCVLAAALQSNATSHAADNPWDGPPGKQCVIGTMPAELLKLLDENPRVSGPAASPPRIAPGPSLGTLVNIKTKSGLTQVTRVHDVGPFYEVRDAQGEAHFVTRKELQFLSQEGSPLNIKDFDGTPLQTSGPVQFRSPKGEWISAELTHAHPTGTRVRVVWKDAQGGEHTVVIPVSRGDSGWQIADPPLPSPGGRPKSPELSVQPPAPTPPRPAVRPGVVAFPEVNQAGGLARVGGKSEPFAGFVERGPDKSVGEDALLVLRLPDRQVYLSIDGMGGHGGGEHASQIIAQSVHDDIMAGKSLEDAIRGAPTRLAQALRRNQGARDMGAVLAGVEIQGDQTRFVHVGDSKGIVVRGGKALFETKDHSVIQKLIDRGQVAPEDAMNHPMRHYVERSVQVDGVTKGLGPDGKHRLTQPESNTFALQKKDRVVLASDGLWDNLMPSEVADIVARAPTPEQATLELKRALQRIKKTGAHHGRKQRFKKDDLNILVYEH